MVNVRYSVPSNFYPHRDHRSKKNRVNFKRVNSKFYKLKHKKKLEEIIIKDLEDY